MCTIRLIRKISSETKIDARIDFNKININLIDIPAYIIYTKENSKHKLEFIFASDKEERTTLNCNNILIEFGINSGRIYILQTDKENINETTTLKIKDKAKATNQTERFKENILNFISLYNQTIKHINNNPHSPKE